jgi:hypothetical protein
MLENLKIKGIVDFKITDSEGNLVKEWTETNLVTNAGRTFFAKKIIDDFSVAGSVVDIIALGSNGTAAQPTNTFLNAEEDRVSINFKSVEDGIATFVTSISGPDQYEVREAGLFTNDDPAVLLAHLILQSPFTKVSNEFLTIIWKIQIG